MKRLLILFSISVVLHSCCKEYCPREQMMLAFVGFEAEDLDTIKIHQYPTGSFSNLIRTYQINLVTSTRDTLDLSYMDSDGADLSKNYESEVSSPATRTYRLSDITTRRYDCSCGQRDGRGVAGYVLDGNARVADMVFINK